MTQNHDKGLAELARLALTRADKAIANPKTSARTIILVIEPLFAINWAGKVLAIVGAGQIRTILWRLRNSHLGPDNYTKIHARLTKSLILPDTITPRVWGIWADLINRYNQFETADLEDWARAKLQPQHSRIWNPTDLTGLSKGEISALSDAKDGTGRLILLWQAAR